jgi:hypothetical protein
LSPAAKRLWSHWHRNEKTTLLEFYTDHTTKPWRATFDHLVAEVRAALPTDVKFLKRVKWELIAWRLGDECFYFYLVRYNEINYRLRIDGGYNNNELPKTFWRIPDSNCEYPVPKHRSELSFHYTEAQSIKGTDLVRFVQDCFRCAEGPDIYRWPLFFDSGRWNQDYAWTVLGNAEQIKRDRVYWGRRRGEAEQEGVAGQEAPLVTISDEE